MDKTIQLHAAVPPKPTFGAPCNGCGVCCAAEPCPLSRFLLGHRAGPCPALTWIEAEHHYRCGMVIAPAQHVTWLPERVEGITVKLCRRWIASGLGCDFDAEVESL